MEEGISKTWTERKLTIRMDWLVLGLLYFAASVHFIPALNSISLYAVIPLLTFTTLLMSRRVFLNAYIVLYFLLISWLACSILWATNPELAMAEVKAAVGTGMLCYIVSYWMRVPDMRKWLYGMYAILLAAALYYAYTEILPYIILGSERVNDDELNANMLAYYSFYFMIAVFIAGDIVERKWLRIVLHGLAWISIGLSLLIGVLTASRQVVVIQVPLYLVLIYVRYFKDNQNRYIRALIICLSMFLVYAAYTRYSASFSDNLLVSRIMGSGSDDNRFVLLRTAYDLGWEHPLTGVGAGNYIIHNPYFLFSHNTFAELWANTGIIGLLLFSIMLGLFVFRQFKYYRATKNVLFLYFFWFGVFFIAYQMLYVFYASLWLMSFFMLIASHSESLYEEELEKIAQKGGDE